MGLQRDRKRQEAVKGLGKRTPGKRKLRTWKVPLFHLHRNVARRTKLSASLFSALRGFWKYTEKQKF